MDGLERRGLRPRSQNRDVRVPETRRIRDVSFEERFVDMAVMLAADSVTGRRI